MITLYLDTTSSFLYAGIVKDDILLTEIKKELGKDLSTCTLDILQKMLKGINLKPKDINKIIVVNGPGSFTGIRVGITIAKTFAWATKTKITTISSLDAMAISNTYKEYKIPVIDARRDYSYYGIYDKNNEKVIENNYESNNVIINKAKELDGNYIFISNDENFFSKCSSYSPDILKIVKFYKNKEDINPHKVNPIYLKSTEAEDKISGN